VQTIHLHTFVFGNPKSGKQNYPAQVITDEGKVASLMQPPNCTSVSAEDSRHLIYQKMEKKHNPHNLNHIEKWRLSRTRYESVECLFLSTSIWLAHGKGGTF
jgi:hypothetical protein